MSEFGVTQETYSPDNLIAGVKQLITKGITLLSGENRSRGALLGKITKALGTVAADGGNTGNGTITGTAMGKLAIIGTYTIECVEAITNGGRFKVIDPNGNRLNDAVVGAAYSTDHLGFTLNDGATDFIVGDKFTFAVDAGSGKYQLSLAAAVDGSQDPVGILTTDTDASAADVETSVYTEGEFDEDSVTYGTGHTKDSVRDALNDLGIVLKSTR